MAKAWTLKSRPSGLPEDGNFALVELPHAPLAPGQVRVRNEWLSVDPYMRGRMNDMKSYVPPFQLDQPMEGGAVGRVIESNADGYAVGDLMLHMHGWRDEAVVDTKAEGMAAGQKLPESGLPPQTFLHSLGLTGATAWVGLNKVAEAKPGETVFVSAAAGAVGSAVVQLAKAKGMTVIGSAGGADKCDFVKDLGADATIDYKSGSVFEQLMQAAPDGIDVYFDNVGGEHLDAAFGCARQFARFAICGMIDVYNDFRPMSFRFMPRTIMARIRMQGFIYTDYASSTPEFLAEVMPMVASGQLKARETVVDGLENTVNAFRGLFSGQNTGKMLVRL